MKYFIASDIHGSAYFCDLLVKAFENSNADKLVLLGDVLYHGPRNDLPKDYAPKKVIEMLNPLAQKIIAIRGNCDAEVDQMVLNFDVLQTYKKLDDFYLTHGHHIDEIDIKKGSIVLCGHTHIPTVEERENYTYLNVGSVSIPKENSAHSYVIFEDNVFSFFNLLTGEKYKTYEIWFKRQNRCYYR